MANFFPKKLLELDSFLKVRFLSFLGPGLSVQWDKSCVDSVFFCTVKHSHFLPFIWNISLFILKRLMFSGWASVFQEPILNIHDLTQIHSDMNLPVPDPILLTNSHDGLDGVSVLYLSSSSEAVGSLSSISRSVCTCTVETVGFGSGNVSPGLVTPVHSL